MNAVELLRKRSRLQRQLADLDEQIAEALEGKSAQKPRRVVLKPTQKDLEETACILRRQGVYPPTHAGPPGRRF